MPKLPQPRNRDAHDIAAQDDPRRNPDGIYSGMTKRLAISDGSFASVSNASKDTRKRGRIT